MTRNKIFNDPIYGFISVHNKNLMRLIEHPYFQRLRRIKQLGLTHYVYPGAVHTRFNHALGAYHLMTEALLHLQQKGHAISQEEFEAAQMAILLHDIGHGPFSHVLEHSLVNVHHETITLWMMESLNRSFGGMLDLAIEVFQGRHPKKFLHQLISSQLDVDRLDYLKRDSFYTGVVEGNIGIDRLIMMMDVSDQNLILEEKSIYTIEKFLSSRRIMYLQVYLHKTALIAEKTLRALLYRIGEADQLRTGSLAFNEVTGIREGLENQSQREKFIAHFARLDDVDVWALLKNYRDHPDPQIAAWAAALLDRTLSKIEITHEPSPDVQNTGQVHETLKGQRFKIDFTAYDPEEGEIMIRQKNGLIVPLSSYSEFSYLMQKISRYYTVK
ncbi:MAG: HD domain-containing protein [Saprospiraceae bacterium]